MKKNKALRKSDIFYHIVKGWRIILLFTLIGVTVGVALIGFSYIRGEVSREYRITSSFAVVGNKSRQVTATEAKGGNDSGSNDMNMARSMTETAMYIVKSRKNMDAVVEHLGLRGVSANDISRNLSLVRYNETEVVEMTLLWRSEKEGLSIMNAINEVSTSSIRSSLKVGEVSVINEPTATFIVGGNISISTWIYAAVAGLVFGIVICILRFLIAPTLVNEDDITSIFGVDTLGSLPLDRFYARQKPLSKSDLPIMDDIKSSAHLLLGHLENAGVNKLYVTSTMHDEGKTRLIADIALQLARLGKKTLLIDCNFRNPMLGALFIGELPYEKTLNALYRGDADKLDAITRINGCLDLLPSVLERNPENFNDALLAQMKQVMDGYDYVLIDAAPVGTDAEVLRLNEITDTVLYVVRFDHAKIDDIKRAMQRIAKSGIPVVGAIFNCVVNWRQTIINAPKRLTNSLKREQKRREKDTKKRNDYQEKREKANSKTQKAKPPVALSDIEKSANVAPAPTKATKSAKKQKKKKNKH